MKQLLFASSWRQQSIKPAWLIALARLVILPFMSMKVAVVLFYVVQLVLSCNHFQELMYSMRKSGRLSISWPSR